MTEMKYSQTLSSYAALLCWQFHCQT